jgi:hypothetical protein
MKKKSEAKLVLQSGTSQNCSKLRITKIATIQLAQTDLQD